MRKLILISTLLSIALLIHPSSLTLRANAASQPPRKSDFDADGSVGFSDFLLFVELYETNRDDAQYQARYDLDGDGVIGFGDFLIFVTDFGKVTSPRPDYQTMNLPDGAIARLGKGFISIFEVAFSPNGEQLAVASGIGIWLYDVATACEVALLTGHTNWVDAVAFSPDGDTLASGGWDRTVRLWDAKTGRLTATLEHNFQVYTVAFSPDGDTIASAGYDPVTLWDVKT